MEELTVKGIILNSAPQGEYGRRLTILTDRLGKVTVFASGAAKAGSHIIGSTRPLTAAEFDLAKGRGAWNLHSVRVIDAFGELPMDIDVSFYASYVLELGEYFSEAGMPEEDAKALLNLMFVSLSAFRDKQLSPLLIRRLLELRILKLQGEYTTEPAGIKDGAPVSEGVRALWRHALTAPLSGLFDRKRIGTAGEVLPEVTQGFSDSVEQLFFRQIPHRFRSTDILRDI